MNSNEIKNNPTTSGIANPSQPPTVPPSAIKSLPPHPPHPPYSSSPSYSSHSSDSSHESHSSHFPPPPSTAPRSQSIEADFPHFPLNFLKKSSRSDDRLANLPPEDQAQIVHWFALGYTYHKIIELAAQPRPDGLNLRLSLGVLHRFYHKHDLAEKIAAAAELVAELCPENASDPETAFAILAQTHALHAMAAPTLDQPAFRHLSRYLLRQQEYKLRQRSLDLREKRLAFDMQHKHYDIVKRTVEKLPDINETVRNQSLTFKERYREMRIKLFGREAVEMIERANEKWHKLHPDLSNTEPNLQESDLLPPMTPEQQQTADAEAFNSMMGWTPSQPDTSDQTHPL